MDYGRGKSLKYNKMDKLLSENKIEELINVHEAHCVSIYLPTHRVNNAGEGYDKDRITLKNLLQEAQKKLEEYNLKNDEIKKFLKPIYDLMEDLDFWKHQSDGLVFFISKDKFYSFSIPISFNEDVSIGSQFNFKQLANVLANNQLSCYLLSLSLNQVELYKVNKLEIFRIEVGDLIPEKMTDTVGEDYEEKHLEGRVSNKKASDGAQYDNYHGHGRSNDTIKKEEALRFFQQIDNGLEPFLNQEKLPLIVACVDYLFPIYKKANSYNFLENKFIEGNPEHTDIEKLADQSINILKEKAAIKTKESVENYKELLAQGKALEGIKEVVPAVIGGRVKKLFISRESSFFGKYLSENHSIQLSKNPTIGDTDLINLAVIESIKKQSEIYLLNPIEMPAANVEIAAILRY